jgi:hypothetical protein
LILAHNNAEITPFFVIGDLQVFAQGSYLTYLLLLGIGWQVAVCRVTAYQRCSFPSQESNGHGILGVASSMAFV